MVRYQRDYSPGASYFSTLTLLDRHADYLTKHINHLSNAFRTVRAKVSFITHAIVVLPDHIYCIWRLPTDDSDCSQRTKLIKTYFTQSILKINSPLKKNSRGTINLCQTRFWEHRMRDDKDLQSYVDYIYYNSVKHGYVTTPID